MFFRWSSHVKVCLVLLVYQGGMSSWLPRFPIDPSLWRTAVLWHPSYSATAPTLLELEPFLIGTLQFFKDKLLSDVWVDCFWVWHLTLMLATGRVCRVQKSAPFLTGDFSVFSYLLAPLFTFLMSLMFSFYMKGSYWARQQNERYANG